MTEEGGRSGDSQLVSRDILGQVIEEGSRVEIVGLFFEIYNKNGALLMMVKRSRNCNRLYKILLKDHQHFLKVSIGVGSK